MTATSTYSPTGDTYVDGVLTGIKWGVTSLTFGFPSDPSFYGTGYGSGEPSNNFEAFTAQQQGAVRAILTMYASVVNLTFTEVAETSSVHGDLRYAETDAVSTAWGYYPSTSAAGGDTWFNNTTNWYDNPIKGNYGYLTMMHETGHALGLKHPHEARGSFAAMPLDHDSLEYSVMSYRSYVGASTTGGYTNGSTSYPQTLMMYDIAALQTMYGANYNTNSGNSVYKWSPTTGEMSIDGVGQGAPAGNKIFMTIWDGGGDDTFDFSNYATNLTVNLNPGEWTTVSATQLAALGNGHYAAGNIANALLYQDNVASLIENVIGGSGNDTIVGNLADNVLTGGRGNDMLDGGTGDDTAVYFGLLSNYLLVQNADGTWTVTDQRTGSPDGIDTLANMELLQFSDTTFTIGAPPPPPPPPPVSTNQAPVAMDDLAVTLEDSALDINVRANDSDPDGDPLSISGAPTALHGTVTVNADGTLHYVPNANYYGADTISYLLTDGALADSGQVAVTVTAMNDAPVAQNDAYATAKNTKLVVSVNGVLANDGDVDGNGLSALLVGKPLHGKLALKADGTFSYTPDRGFVGTDSFSYRDSDGSATSNVATVTITVGQAAAGQAGGAGPGTMDQIPAPAGADAFDFGFCAHAPQGIAPLLEVLQAWVSQSSVAVEAPAPEPVADQVHDFVTALSAFHHASDFLWA